MSDLVAALPMYDWPERHDEVDAEWRSIRDSLRASGIDAPDTLTRETGDLHAFWRRPDLLFAQTCWGPMEDGLAAHVQVVGQPSYDGIEGGAAEFYSSALVMRREGGRDSVPPPASGAPLIDLSLLRGARFAYNVPDSMSGFIGLTRDLERSGESLKLFSEHLETGGHRKSIRAVAECLADVAAIDCLSWNLAQRYEPGALHLRVVGWTGRRKGLPYITSVTSSSEQVNALREAIRLA